MTPRLATIGDVPALTELIPLSARELSRGYYTDEQTEAAIRHIFGPDTRLISDRTYFVVEEAGALAGCGGWSRRRTLFGGDQTKRALAEELLLDPATDAAKIRAFFVHPAFARRGVGLSSSGPVSRRPGTPVSGGPSSPRRSRASPSTGPSASRSASGSSCR